MISSEDQGGRSLSRGSRIAFSVTPMVAILEMQCSWRTQLMSSHLLGVATSRGPGFLDCSGMSWSNGTWRRSTRGVMLECTDPDGAQERAAPLRGGARQYLQTWRQVGRAFVASDPAPRRPQTLSSFVDAWQSRTSQTEQRWPSEWPVLELCYKVVTWLPSFYDDPEGQVYWEAISRGIAQAATFSPYRSTILHGQGVHDDRSVQQAIIDVMAPLAENAVEVDEDIMPHIPRGRLPIMTVHQAKGLEFPLVIVDVSSDFATNHRTQRFKRFPEGPSSVQRMEDDLAPYCEIGDLRLQRPGTLRAFDDLIRLYYVAYSRPQSLLLLVGMRATLRYSTLIQNVAMGWRSDGSWSWAKPVSGRPPALANNVPLELI
jgi:DNA helicase-2/ATP-dependent DNA helicase PcrA